MPKHETVPSFESIQSLNEALEKKDAYAQCDLYPRDGQSMLGDAEEIAADLVGVDPNQILIFNNGMAAIDTAVKTALLSCGMGAESRLAASSMMYSQTKLHIRDYDRLGINISYFHSGDEGSIDNAINKQPDVIFSETVGNGPNTPVFDFRKALIRAYLPGHAPITILDNTLPLSTGLPLADQISERDRIIVVESGTKSYTQNGEISGIAYTKHPELLEELKFQRRKIGSIPGVGSSERIKLLLPESKRAFDERNKNLFKNTSLLAKILDEIAAEEGSFIVSHPSLKEHDNYKLATELGLPDGGSPVLFLQPLVPSAFMELTSRIWEDKLVKDNSKLGQSFGFDHTRILPERNSGTVRVAGGAETNVEELGEGFRRALLA